MGTLPTMELVGGLRVDRLVQGCWRIARDARDDEERRERGRRALRAALDAGCTTFDLADVYGGGAAEERLGEVLRERPTLRDRLTLITKCGVRFKGDGGSEAPYRYDLSAGHIIASCEGSLRRLRTDVIDLFLLHRPDYLLEPEEVASAFDRLHREGKARFFGVSNFRPSQFAALQRHCSHRLLVNQVEISLLRLDAFHDGTLDQCLAEGIVPMAWSPLAEGRLAEPHPVDLRTEDHARKIHIREVLSQISRDRHLSLAAVALAWLLAHPARIVPVIGTTDPSRIRECLQAADAKLTRTEWYRLMEAAMGARLP